MEVSRHALLQFCNRALGMELSKEDYDTILDKEEAILREHLDKCTVFIEDGDQVFHLNTEQMLCFVCKYNICVTTYNIVFQKHLSQEFNRTLLQAFLEERERITTAINEPTELAMWEEMNRNNRKEIRALQERQEELEKWTQENEVKIAKVKLDLKHKKANLDSVNKALSVPIAVLNKDLGGGK